MGLRAFGRSGGRVVAGLVLCLCAATAAEAQAFRWWQDDEVRRELSLTAIQVHAIEQVYDDTLPTRRRLRLECDRAEAELDAALRRGDDTGVERLVDRATDAYKRRNVARTRMLLRIRRILTSEQRSRLEQVGVSLTSVR